MEILRVEQSYTLCTGIDNIKSGIETKVNQLATNKEALNLLNLVSLFADKDNAIYFFCYYLSELNGDVGNDKERIRKLLESNCKLQILCSGETLEKLKKSLT